jgi:hypothetical protein
MSCASTSSASRTAWALHLLGFCVLVACICFGVAVVNLLTRPRMRILSCHGPFDAQHKCTALFGCKFMHAAACFDKCPPLIGSASLPASFEALKPAATKRGLSMCRYHNPTIHWALLQNRSARAQTLSTVVVATSIVPPPLCERKSRSLQRLPRVSVPPPPTCSPSSRPRRSSITTCRLSCAFDATNTQAVPDSPYALSPYAPAFVPAAQLPPVNPPAAAEQGVEAPHVVPYPTEHNGAIQKHKRVWVAPTHEVMLVGDYLPHVKFSGDCVLCKISTTAPIIIPGKQSPPICTSRDDVKFTDVEFTDSWGRHVVVADIARIGCVLLRGCGIRPVTGCAVQPPTRP